MPRRDDGKVDEDRSYGFVVVPCVRRNFPQCRRLSVRDEATRQNGTGQDGTRRDAGMRRVASRRDAAPAHRVAPTYVHIPRLRHCSVSPSPFLFAYEIEHSRVTSVGI